MKNIIVLLLSFALLGCHTPTRSTSEAIPYPTIENLSPAVLKSFHNSTREQIRSIIGEPLKTYPQDGGEAWEYKSEHQQLTLTFYDQGTVQSMSYEANPDFIKGLQKLDGK